jgi:Tfp pilus assembly protein PilN
VRKNGGQRARTVDRAEVSFGAASQKHETEIAALEKERAQLDERAQIIERWDKTRERLKAAIRKARD